jgi:HAD superfamily hydrolase (TIGR01484 family)
MPIKLISTDFDGTLFAEFENPPIPERLQELIGSLQQRGAKWVINTGRDMSGLMEALGRAHIAVEPDYLVLVEREIFLHHESSYVGLEPWNGECEYAHSGLFARIEPDLAEIVQWVQDRFHARIYEDPFSPFCIIASSNDDMDTIHEYLNTYSATVPNLSVVRNDVYARFCHTAYNKGTALRELGQRLGVAPAQTFAAGDHLNDLPMLKREFAHCLATPVNGVPQVKAQVLAEQGFVSDKHAGWGIAEALEFYINGARAQ